MEKSNRYTQFYQERSEAGDFIMMDNSVIELGEPVELKRVLWAAKKVHAHEIILPDILHASNRTVELITDALVELQQLRNTSDFANYNFKVQAVPQGETVEDWFECLNRLMPLVETGGIHTIGVPRCCNELEDGTRADVLEALDAMFYPSMPDFEVHLLGLSDNITEIKKYRQYPWIRGIDSKLPIRAGMNLVKFDQTKGMLVTKEGMPQLDMMYGSYDPEPEITYHNIEVMMEMANVEL